MRPPKCLQAISLAILAIMLAAPVRGAGVSAVDVDTPTAAPPASASMPYTIRKDDEINIQVAGHDELKADLTVLPDGSISVPQAGTIQAAGLTVAKLTQVLVNRLSKTINQPDVTVSVHASPKNPGAKVSVLGAVKDPGQFDAGENEHILDIIAAAGGLLADPSLSKGTLIRAGGAGTVPLDFTNLYANPTSYLNIAVNPGDVLLVESQMEFQIQISGEVAKPGAYPVAKDGTPIFDLILLAGGPTKAAALKQAQVMHNGHLTIVDLSSFGTNLTGTVNTTKLMPGDVLQIPQIVDRYAVLGEVHEPGTYDIPDGGTMGLRLALVRSGGLTTEADIKNTSLLRTDPTGKAVVVPLKCEAMLAGKSPDVPLMPGDIIYVPVIHPKAPFNPLSLVSLIPLLQLFR